MFLKLYFFATFVLLNSLILVTSDDVNSPARLLVEKRVLNKYLVENKDIIINYNIYNIGGRFVVDFFKNKTRY